MYFFTWMFICIFFSFEDFFLTFIFAYLFIYLAALGLSHSTQDLPSLLRHESSLVGARKLQTLSCGMWDLVPSPGIKPGPPVLGLWSLSHWTTRDVTTSRLLSGAFDL